MKNICSFVERIKLSDWVLANKSLLNVLLRFGIRLGVGDQTIRQVCEKQAIDESLLLLVGNVYSQPEYSPGIDDLTLLNGGGLIDYLKASHDDYRSRILVSIELRLEELRLAGHDAQLVGDFFREFRTELLQHFRYEEDTVFPYILSLIDGKWGDDLNFEQFDENHESIEDKLSDLKNILLKYLPDPDGASARYDILADIFNLEDDLLKHTWIEDKILIPFVQLKMELYA